MTIEQLPPPQLNDVPPEQALREIREHLEFLYAGVEGHIVLSWPAGRGMGGRSFDLGALDHAAHFVLSLRESENVYLNSCVVRTPMNKKPQDADASALCFLSLDFDGAWGKHKKADEKLPQTPEDLDRLIEASGYPPYTRALLTGGGLLALWVLEEPIVFASPEERLDAKDSALNFQLRLRQAAKERFGWDLDTTSDLSRLTRLPHTLNHKYDPPRATSAWGEDGPRLSLADLRKFGEPLPKAVKPSSSAPRSKKRDHEQERDDKPSVESIRAGCAFIAHAFDNAEVLAEPEWKAALDIVVHCEDGVAHAHAMSRPYPGYDESETQAKIERSLGFGKARTCDNIREELQFEGCQRCPFSQTCHSPIALGYQVEGLVEVARQYAFVANRKGYIDLDGRETFIPSALSTLYAHKLDVSAHKAMSQWYGALKVKGTTYVPAGELVEDERLNLWRPGGVDPRPGSWAHIETLLETLLPEAKDRDHLLDLLAFLVQRPGEKVNHMPVIRGIQGSGKSTIEHIVKALVGDHNCRVAQGSSLAGRFWADLTNTQVLVFEETSHEERSEVATRIKELVTARHIQVEEKGIPFYQARTPDLVFAISNEQLPFRLEPGDRRFWIPEYGERKQPVEFYAELYQALDAEVPALKAELLARNIADFNAKAPAPMTEAKAKVIEFSQPEMEQYLKQAIQERTEPFDIDLVWPEELVPLLRLAGFSSTNVSRVRKALTRLRAASVGQLPANYTTAPNRRVWAVRNLDHWKEATAAELRNHYSRQSVVLDLAQSKGKRAA
ncbi:DUF5906 domain-containing protein [Brevundimonas sp.]|uniref:primase-helicase family protein n=1 Tax=Brevundimonas sp. TaxID=1871086 RepID=UPI0025D64A1F|nr:DUF5906 domain-containing protein [Brevundimonas sp.]